jgi:hypothetical protein
LFRRLELSYDVDEPGLPRTLIAKFSTPDPEMRAAIHSMGFYGREAAFYRELGATTPVPRSATTLRSTRTTVDA